MSTTTPVWQCHPQAEQLLLNVLEQGCQANPMIADLKKQLQEQTSTRLFDWIDHVMLSFTPELESQLIELGFVSAGVTTDYTHWHHPGAQLPHIVLKDRTTHEMGIAVSVDHISDFLMVRGMTGGIEGTALSGYRRCCISIENGISLWVVERRGTYAMEPTEVPEHNQVLYLQAKEGWKTRPRSIEDDEEAMSRALSLAEHLVHLVGQDLAAWIVLECEREYWQVHNTAGQLQKNRQDRLGMGWANHDHHTFRSSRRHFHKLVRLFEILGFYCRERFYAGKEAGWGAQIMEHPNCRLVLFLDVDLLPEEIEIDFRRQQLKELTKLATVGLWCELHGDSILNAGMHHLEAQFLFDDLTKDLAEVGVGMMEPFSAFPFLRQAFTKGEVWRVSEHKLQKLRRSGKITQEQAEKFRSKGAIGSHLENLQRREGYKGFNQKNVSYIIHKTDPRTVSS